MEKRYEAKLAMLHELQEDIDAVTKGAEDTWQRIAYKLLHRVKKIYLPS